MAHQARLMHDSLLAPSWRATCRSAEAVNRRPVTVFPLCISAAVIIGRSNDPRPPAGSVFNGSNPGNDMCELVIDSLRTIRPQCRLD